MTDNTEKPAAQWNDFSMSFAKFIPGIQIGTKTSLRNEHATIKDFLWYWNRSQDIASLDLQDPLGIETFGKVCANYPRLEVEREIADSQILSQREKNEWLGAVAIMFEQVISPDGAHHGTWLKLRNGNK